MTTTSITANSGDTSKEPQRASKVGNADISMTISQTTTHNHAQIWVTRISATQKETSMAWGKSPEEKKRAEEEENAEWRSERQERLAATASADKDKQHRKFLASPVGIATRSMERGDAFFQLTLDANGVELALLPQIEDLGWHLENVGYVFVQTGASSRDYFLSSGQSTRISGAVNAIYLFRSTKRPTKPRDIREIATDDA